MRRPDEWRGPYWEPRDIWLGVYWDSTRERRMNASIGVRRLDVYICLVPCFPLKVTWFHEYVVDLLASGEVPGSNVITASTSVTINYSQSYGAPSAEGESGSE